MSKSAATSSSAPDCRPTEVTMSCVILLSVRSAWLLSATFVVAPSKSLLDEACEAPQFRIMKLPNMGLGCLLFVGSLAAQGPGEKRWEFQTEHFVYSSPTIGADGTVYAGSWDRKLYALDGQTGVKRWEFQTEGLIESPPIVGSDGTVYIGSSIGGSDSRIYALDGHTGAERWSYWLRGLVLTPAIGKDGTVYAAGLNGVLSALDGKTGVRRSGFTGGLGVISGPVISAEGTIFVVDSNRMLVARDGQTGVQKWEFSVGTPQFWTSPAIGRDGTIYIGNDSGKLYAIDGQTGVSKWEFQTEGAVRSSPAIDVDGTVFFGSDDKKVYALDSQTGTKKWEFLTGDWVWSSPAVGNNGTVYFGSGDKKLYAVDGTTGLKKWEFLTGDWIRSSPTIGEDGTVYIGSTDKKIYAVASDSMGLAESSWPMLGGGPGRIGRVVQPPVAPKLKLSKIGDNGVECEVIVEDGATVLVETSSDLVKWTEIRRVVGDETDTTLKFTTDVQLDRPTEFWRARRP